MYKVECYIWAYGSEEELGHGVGMCRSPKAAHAMATDAAWAAEKKCPSFRIANEMDWFVYLNGKLVSLDACWRETC